MYASDWSKGMGELCYTRFKKIIAQISEYPINIQEDKLYNFIKD